MSIRTARPDEAPALARLINAAFVVEAFFKIGDRTSADDVAALMEAGGEFLVLDGLPHRNRRSRNRNWNRNLYRLRLFEIERRPRVFRDAVHRP